jgi:hypothetical protein
MDEQRVQAYLSLIQELLNSPGEANQILNSHLKLVDEGFVQVCEQVAAQLQEAGQENNAGFVRNLAQQLGAFLAQQGTGGNQQGALEDFWRQLLQARMQGDTAAVHQVRRQNMGLIVPALGDVIAQSMPGLREDPVLDKALPQVTQLQGFQPHSKSQPAKFGCSRDFSLRIPTKPKGWQA